MKSLKHAKSENSGWTNFDQAGPYHSFLILTLTSVFYFYTVFYFIDMGVVILQSSWQTVFNTFGALTIASDVFGIGAAILLRIATNVFASLYSLVFNGVIQRMH